MDEQSPPAAKTSRPRRRWYQFSLRTFLVVTTLIALCMPWIVRSERQRIAAEQLKQEGVKYYFDIDELKNWYELSPVDRSKQDELTQKLNQRILPWYEHYFRNISELHIWRSRDPLHIQWHFLPHITKIYYFSPYSTKSWDKTFSDVSPLQDAHSVRELTINTMFPRRNRSLADFPQFDNLEKLTLVGDSTLSNICDDDMKEVVKQKKLKSICFYNVSVQDALHLDPFSKSVAIEEIHFGGLNSCKESIRKLIHVKNIKKFRIYIDKQTKQFYDDKFVAEMRAHGKEVELIKVD